MPHIHRESAQYDFTVSAFIVHRGKKAILLHRHKTLGVLLQPGGHVELDEHPWQAMSHELLEETGYELRQLSVLQHNLPLPELKEVIHPTPLVLRTHSIPGLEPLHWHTDMAYGLITSEEPLNKPGKDESQELTWFTAEQIEAFAPHEMPEDARSISLHVLAHHAIYEHVDAVSFPHD